MESDRDAETLTIRNKETREITTLNLADVQEGRITFESDGKEVTLGVTEDDDGSSGTITISGDDDDDHAHRWAPGWSEDDRPEVDRCLSWNDAPERLLRARGLPMDSPARSAWRPTTR